MRCRRTNAKTRVYSGTSLRLAPVLARRLRVAVFALLTASCLLAAVAKANPAPVTAGDDGGTVIRLRLWDLPDPTRTDVHTRAKSAVVQEFARRFPDLFARRYRARYESEPERYGRHDWSRVEIELQRFSGLSIEGMGMDSAPLMAIAGGVAPDVLYVNFRQSDTYIQQRFLYPLDKPEDGYLAGLTDVERDFWVHERIWPVIRRRGPEGTVQVWAMPMGGILGRVMLYRKDLLEAANVPFPDNNWTWQDLLEACRALTRPEHGTYGIRFGRGPSESVFWTSFLWSAGGDIMEYDEATDQWRAVFNTAAGVTALDFYTRLTTEPWRDSDGRRRYGYAIKEPAGFALWDLGKVGFQLAYIDEQLFATINPDLIGVVPVPIGPDGHRGSELNARMQGIFAGVENPVVRDAAWEYMRFVSSRDAVEIETRIMVEGGLGHFVNPRYLRMFGYDDIVRLAPPGWEEAFRIAIESGRPEPYGRNCQHVYHILTRPIQRAEQWALSGALPEDGPERAALLRRALDESAREANERMIGHVPAERMRVRRRVAGGVLLLALGLFAALLRHAARAFVPSMPTPERRPPRFVRFRKLAWAYAMILPAVASIFFWHYLPLLRGSVMAFQDYRIMGDSPWVGLDNFANLLWDPHWWQALYNALRYSLFVVGLTFLPPVVLAILLQEIPRGTLLFRTLYYLPAVVTGLVVVYLWRSFYEPTDTGMLNALIMRIPAGAFLALGVFFLWIGASFMRRLALHGRRAGGALCALAGIGLFLACARFAHTIVTDPDHALAPWYRLPFLTLAEPYRWLQDPATAMFACVLPMAWAGMGPGCLIYLAALKGIPNELYEAADMDGATFIDKILFVIVPRLKPLLVIQFVGLFIQSWNNSAHILAMTAGAAETETAGLHIFYRAYMHLRFGEATAMAWMLGFLLIGFTVHQLRILATVEFKTIGDGAP